MNSGSLEPACPRRAMSQCCPLRCNRLAIVCTTRSFTSPEGCKKLFLPSVAFRSLPWSTFGCRPTRVRRVRHSPCDGGKALNSQTYARYIHIRHQKYADSIPFCQQEFVCGLKVVGRAGWPNPPMIAPELQGKRHMEPGKHPPAVVAAKLVRTPRPSTI